MNLSRIKTLIPAPEDGSDGKMAASAIFTPPVIWVDADEDGWSLENLSINVEPSVVVDGVSCGFTDPLTIVSAPPSVSAVYNSSLGVIVISISEGTAPAYYEGEVKVQMAATVGGQSYGAVGLLPIVAKRKGQGGEDGVTYELVTSVQKITSDSDGNILTGGIGLTAYKTVAGVRTSCALGTIVGPMNYRAQYSIDGGTWTDCTNDVSILSGSGWVRAYGAPSSAVETVRVGIAFRLLYGASLESSTVVHEIGALPIVSNGADGDPGSPGSPGSTGLTGPWWWPAGFWNSTYVYERTTDSFPVVEYEGHYYYPKAVGTIAAGGNPPDDNNAWQLATQFKVVFVEALFAEFAKLGSAIINGDWMISQHGKLYGVDSSTYTLFDPSDPEGKVNGHFRPNYAVDLKNGVSYLNKSKIRGILRVMAIYTLEGSLKTADGKKYVDLENEPGNSYVIPGNTTVYVPDPTDYEGLSLTIIFSAGGVLACDNSFYLAYYTGSTKTNVIELSMAPVAFHSEEGLAVLTIQAIKAFGSNSGISWVVVGQRGVLDVRSSVDGADQYKLLPDGKLLM